MIATFSARAAALAFFSLLRVHRASSVDLQASIDLPADHRTIRSNDIQHLDWIEEKQYQRSTDHIWKCQLIHKTPRDFRRSWSNLLSKVWF